MNIILKRNLIAARSIWRWKIVAVILLSLSAAALASVLFIPEALAGTGTKVAAGAAAVFTNAITIFAVLALIQGFSALLLNLAITVFDSMVAANVYIRDLLSTDGVAYLAWTVMRDLVNAGFILIILAGAFGIIFNLPQFNAKRLLIKVVLIALLVNFSFVMVNFLFAFTSSVASAFANQVRNPAATISAQLQLKDLGEAVQPPPTPDALTQEAAKCSRDCADLPEEYDQCIARCTQASLGAGKERSAFAQAFVPSAGAIAPFIVGAGIFLAKIAGYSIALGGIDYILGQIFGSDITGYSTGIDMILKIIYNTVAALVFLTGAIFLIVRIVAAVILAIISPLAFVAATIPSTANLFSRWLSALFNWAFFAPIFIFFVLISAKFTETLQLATAARGLSASPAQHPAYFLTLYVFSLAFLVGALVVSKKMSLAGASAAMGLGRAALGLAAGGATFGAGALTRRFAPELQTGIQKASGVVGRVPGIKWMAAPILEKGEGFIAKQRKEADEFYEGVKAQGTEALVSGYLRTPDISSQKKAGYIRALAERGKLGELERQGISSQDMMTIMRRFGREEDVLKTRLDLVTAKPGQTREQTMAELIEKKFKEEDFGRLSADSLRDAATGNLKMDVLRVLAPRLEAHHLRRIARENPEVRELINRGLVQEPGLVSQFKPHTYQYIVSQPAQSLGYNLPANAPPPTEIEQQRLTALGERRQELLDKIDDLTRRATNLKTIGRGRDADKIEQVDIPELRNRLSRL